MWVRASSWRASGSAFSSWATAAQLTPSARNSATRVSVASVSGVGTGGGGLMGHRREVLRKVRSRRNVIACIYTFATVNGMSNESSGFCEIGREQPRDPRGGSPWLLPDAPSGQKTPNLKQPDLVSAVGAVPAAPLVGTARPTTTTETNQSDPYDLN